MTTITLKIKDDSKTLDVIRFLKDIDFLEISENLKSQSETLAHLNQFPGLDLGWNHESMSREDMNAR